MKAGLIKIIIEDAQDIFTDRKSFRDAFWEAYNFVDQPGNEEEVKILNYYGVSGIGKTKLLQTIKKEVEQKKNTDCVYYDLSVKKEVSLILFDLERRFQKIYRGLSFDVFDYALMMYVKKSGENDYAYQTSGSNIAEDVKDIALGLAGDVIPVVGGATAEGIRKVMDIIKNKINEYIKNGRYKAEYQLINRSTPSEIKEMLYKFWTEDVNRYFVGITHHDPVIIMLDSYESLVDVAANAYVAGESDMWLRAEKYGLIYSIPGAVWIIAGRNFLNWKIIENTDRHLIGQLEEEDAVQYFKEVGIDNASLRRDLYKLTDGTPAYMDICKKRYFELKAENNDYKPVIADFGNNTEELAHRYLREFKDPWQQSLLFLLSCIPNMWSDSDIKRVYMVLDKTFDDDKFQLIRSMSLVEKNNMSNGVYRLQRTFRKIVYKYISEEHKEQKDTYEEALIKFYKKSISHDESFDSSYIYYIENFLKIIQRFDHKEKLDFQTLALAISLYYKAGDYEQCDNICQIGIDSEGHFLNKIYFMIWRAHAVSNEIGDDKWEESKNIMIDAISQLESYRLAYKDVFDENEEFVKEPSAAEVFNISICFRYIVRCLSFLAQNQSVFLFNTLSYDEKTQAFFVTESREKLLRNAQEYTSNWNNKDRDRLRREYKDALYDLASKASKIGYIEKMEEAVTVLEGYIDDNVEKCRFHVKNAENYLALGLYEKVISETELAEKVDGSIIEKDIATSVRMNHIKARALSRLGHGEKAIELLDNGIIDSKEYPYVSHIQIDEMKLLKALILSDSDIADFENANSTVSDVKENCTKYQGDESYISVVAKYVDGIVRIKKGIYENNIDTQMIDEFKKILSEMKDNEGIGKGYATEGYIWIGEAYDFLGDKKAASDAFQISFKNAVEKRKSYIFLEKISESYTKVTYDDNISAEEALLKTFEDVISITCSKNKEIISFNENGTGINIDLFWFKLFVDEYNRQAKRINEGKRAENFLHGLNIRNIHLNFQNEYDE